VEPAPLPAIVEPPEQAQWARVLKALPYAIPVALPMAPRLRSAASKQMASLPVALRKLPERPPLPWTPHSQSAPPPN
jgi:hypothetical protein